MPPTSVEAERAFSAAACLPPKFVRGWVTNQSMPSVFCEAIQKKTE